jgi:hypothetical protein
LREVFVDDFVLRAQHDIDRGQWNLSALKIPSPQSARGRMPLVWLENGVAEFSRVAGGRVRVIASTPVSAGLRPAERIVGGYSFNISSAGKQKLEGTAIFGYWRPGRVVVGGRLSSNDIPGFERPWTIRALDTELTYEPNRAYELKAKVKGFSFPASPGAPGRNIFAFDTESVRGKLPFVDALQKLFNKYNPSGSIDINLSATGNLKDISDSRIAGEVRCSDVAVCDRDFAYPAEHITGQIDVTERSVRLRGLTGRHGEVELAFAGWAADFGPDCKYHLQITSEDMLLDKDLYGALNKKEQNFWSAFSPSGVVAINYSRSRLSATEKDSALAVQLLDVNAQYGGFGYPLKQTKGLLFFGTDSVVFSDVISEWDGRRIEINGNIGFSRERPTYDILINAEDVPLDAVLAEALPSAQRDFYNEFETSGRIDAKIKIVRKTGESSEGTFKAEVFPQGSSIKPKVLPVTISNVTGKIILSPDVVEIEGLAGQYSGGSVRLMGRIWPAEKEKMHGYCLTMLAKEIELNEELASSLPGQMSELAAELRPTGKVSLTADVSSDAKYNCGPNRLVIECLGDTIDSNLLPYPLRDISGTIVITRLQVRLEDIAARAVHKIGLEAVGSMMKIDGKIDLGEGGSDGKGPQIIGGEMSFGGENVRFRGKSLARVNAILGYDASTHRWLSRYFVADFYDGKMTGKLELSKSSRGDFDYLLDAGVTGANLRKFLADRQDEQRPAEHYSTGSMDGWLSVSGSIIDNNVRLGRCQARITDMEVGKRSPLAKLLAVLNLTEPKDYTFDQMTLDAYIQDNRMFLRQIDLSGGSLALEGAGRLDLNTNNIDLTLTARGSRLAKDNPSLWESLTEGLGRAVMRVEVKGKVSDPQISTKSLPVIGDTLEILGMPRQ